MTSSKELKVLADIVILEEGGISNHPFDMGGETRYGVTKQYAADHGINFEDITEGTAKKLYVSDAQKYGLSRLNPPECYFLLDAGVLFGFRRVVSWFQMYINAVAGSNLECDGWIGPLTQAAWDSLTHEQRDEVIYRLHERIKAYHRSVVIRNPKQRIFLKGWLLRAERRYERYVDADSLGL